MRLLNTLELKGICFHLDYTVELFDLMLRSTILLWLVLFTVVGTVCFVLHQVQLAIIRDQCNFSTGQGFKYECCGKRRDIPCGLD